MADETEVQSSTEETTETTEAQDTETTEEQERSGAEQEGADDTKDYRKIAEDQRKRAEKAEAELKKLKPKPTQDQALSGDQQRLDRIELNSLSIKIREDQDFVIGAAKRMGVSLSEAASDDIVAARLERMAEARKTKDATPTPGRGTGSSTPNVTKLAEKALATGELPTDPALRQKVREEMKRLTRT